MGGDSESFLRFILSSQPMVSSSQANKNVGGKVARVGAGGGGGGGTFKRTIHHQKNLSKNSLTNRPEFMSQSMPRGPMKRPKPREHEQDIPIEGARLIVKNLEFCVGASDLEELFSSFGQITKCMILRHRDGRSTGICHIDYHDEAAGVEAFNDYNGMPLDGRE